jgi:TonB family protein
MGVAAILLAIGANAAATVVMDKPPAFVTPPKYPAIALRNEISGPVRVRLIVRPNGKVTECAIIASSGYFGLDQGTCASMQKDAAFAPTKDKANRQFEMRIDWSVGGYGSVPDALRVLSSRLYGLREGQSVPPKIVLGACQQQSGFRWCDAGPPPAYLGPDKPSGGKLRLAIDDAKGSVIGFELEFDPPLTVAAAREISYHHGPACFTAKDRSTQGWVAGRSYLVLVTGKAIAGHAEMSPLLQSATAACPRLARP